MPLEFPAGSSHLPPGGHTASVDEVKSALVDSFPGSKTRAPIYEDWLKLRERLSQLITLEIQWLNGSYATTKVDPNDLDLATFANCDEVEGLDPIQEAELNELVSGPSKEAPLCDSFLIVEYPDDHPLHAVSASLRDGFATIFFGNGPGGPGTKGYVEVMA